MKTREIWKVTVRDFDDERFEVTYRVGATSAASAEKAGIALAYKDMVMGPYCAAAIFDGYVNAAVEQQ